jgi:hypothetical protein
LIVLYWSIAGILSRQKEESWGAKIIDRLARIWEWNSLVSKGCSVRKAAGLNGVFED